MENQRNAYEKKLYAQIQEWSVDIALLTVKAATARADEKLDYYQVIKTLERKQDEVWMKLQESKAAGASSWFIDLKRGTEKAWFEFLRAA
jgi:succinylglutamate desuccinylase